MKLFIEEFRQITIKLLLVRLIIYKRILFVSSGNYCLFPHRLSTMNNIHEYYWHIIDGLFHWLLDAMCHLRVENSVLCEVTVVILKYWITEEIL